MRTGACAGILFLGLAVLTSRAQVEVREIAPTQVAPDQEEPDAATTQLGFVFAPKALEQVSWEIRLAADHSGTYREQGASGVSQRIHVGEAVWKRLDAGTKTVRSGRCETKEKGIAQTGRKTISVAGVSGTGRGALVSCTFNFSDDDALNDAAAAFQAVAETMQEGAKLQHDLRFDRLALDADIDVLLDEVAGGRALEPGNISGVLQAMVADDRVIDRVRRKAARLLQGASPAADKPR